MSAMWQALLAQTSLHPLTHQSPDLFVCPLTTHGVTQLTGEQSQSYLQGQLSNDITTLNDGEHLISAHCDAKGKMWSIPLVLRQNDSYYLISGAQENQASCKELQKYGVFAKTEIVDASDELLLFAVGGSDAPSYLNDLNVNPIALQGPLQGHYLLMVNKDQAASIIEKAHQHLYEPQQWQQTTIKAGVAHLDEHSINQYVPQMLNLQALDAICFTKGCYTGQEMVARMKYLGKNKRATYLVKGTATKVPANGDELQLAVGEHWRPAGQLINVAGDQQGFYALAVMANTIDPQSHLRIKDDPQSALSLLPLPYALEQDNQ